MKTNKYFYMGLGALIALAIGGFAFSSFSSAQANEIVALQVIDDTIGTNLSDSGDEMEHRRGPGKGKRGFGGRDNSAIIEELGVSQEEWDAAKEAARAEFADAEEKPDRETVKAFFAEQLGVSVEDIEAAQEAVKEARIAEALANGDITQEDIDRMEARQAVKETIDRKAIAAEILGVTVEELEEGNKQDLIEASGLTREEIAAAMEAAYADAIAQAVEDGIITQEQAALLESDDFGRKGKRGNRGRGQGRGNGVGINTSDA